MAEPRHILKDLVLHRLERLLLLALKDGNTYRQEELKIKTKLSEASVSRASLWLSSKDLAHIEEEKKTTVDLGSEGARFSNNGLPERALVDAVLKAGGILPLERIQVASGLSREDVNIAIGWARRKGWLQFRKEGEKTVLVVDNEPMKGPDETLLDRLSKKPMALDEIGPEFSNGLAAMRERPNMITLTEEVTRSIRLTSLGLALSRRIGAKREEVSQITPELITSGKWKTVVFRKYNIEAPVMQVWPGKMQPYNRFLDDLKWKLVALGFKEMSGPTVEFMFFNCDALYMPQDHPAREIHDIYFVKHPSRGDLSSYAALIRNVKATHEHGGKSGSKGWGYKFSLNETKRLVLRSQGTAQSARMLISKELAIPGKYFSVTRCYRPDVVDRTHLTEFNQVEGIVVSADLTFRDLLGVLEKFAIEIAGADKVRFRPDYFPFTEPSVELAAYKDGVGWLEFGGAGMFRPEVTMPLGIDVPVIAWGLGVDRLFMMKAGISDIRELFSQDLGWLRSQKVA